MSLRVVHVTHLIIHARHTKHGVDIHPFLGNQMPTTYCRHNDCVVFVFPMCPRTLILAALGDLSSGALLIDWPRDLIAPSEYSKTPACHTLKPKLKFIF